MLLRIVGQSRAGTRIEYPQLSPDFERNPDSLGRAVINLNGDLDDLTHYNRTVAIPGDIGANLERLVAALPAVKRWSAGKEAWLALSGEKKRQWGLLKLARFAATAPIDPTWQRRGMTQPQAIRVVAEFARETGAAKLFDAGDVQANGFQIVEDDRPFDTFTECDYDTSTITTEGSWEC